MNKLLFTAVFALLCTLLWAQDKVAVIDVQSEDLSRAVVSMITEKVNERLVNSKRFIVLDRASIRQVLSEREFQMSGMVSDEDVTEAGRYMGADYVLVPSVQIIGDYCFVSIKMINIKTGVITAQASRDDRGSEIIAIRLVEQATDQLLGLVSSDSIPIAQEEKPAPEPAVSSKTEKTAPPKNDYAQVNRVGFRLYSMTGANTSSEELQLGMRANFPIIGLWSMHVQLGVIHSGLATGVAVPVGRFLMPYAGLGFGLSEVELNDSGNDYDDYYEYVFSPYVCLGIDLRFGPILFNTQADIGFAPGGKLIVISTAIGWRF